MGAGPAGICAAAVLRRHAHHVILLSPAQPAEVAQAAHAHVLLSSGFRTLVKLFPELPEALRARGLPVVDLGASWRIELRPGVLPSWRSGLESVGVERAALDRILHGILDARGDVEIMAARSLEARVGRDGYIQSLMIQPAAGSATRELFADAYVDATGARRHLASRVLAANGSESARVEALACHVRYLSIRLDIPVDLIQGASALMVRSGRPSPRHSALITLHPGPGARAQALATLAGAAGEDPGSTLESYRDFALSLGSARLTEIIRWGEPVRPPQRWHFRRSEIFVPAPGATRPPNLFLCGDAGARLNPVWGQGVSSAARHAELLDDALSGPASDPSQSYHDRLLAESRQRLGDIAPYEARWRATDGTIREPLADAAVAGDISAMTRLLRLLNFDTVVPTQVPSCVPLFATSG